MQQRPLSEKEVARLSSEQKRRLGITYVEECKRKGIKGNSKPYVPNIGINGHIYGCECKSCQVAKGWRMR